MDKIMKNKIRKIVLVVLVCFTFLNIIWPRFASWNEIYPFFPIIIINNPSITYFIGIRDYLQPLGLEDHQSDDAVRVDFVGVRYNRVDIFFTIGTPFSRNLTPRGIGVRDLETFAWPLNFQSFELVRAAGRLQHAIIYFSGDMPNGFIFTTNGGDSVFRLNLKE